MRDTSVRLRILKARLAREYASALAASSASSAGFPAKVRDVRGDRRAARAPLPQAPVASRDFGGCRGVGLRL